MGTMTDSALLDFMYILVFLLGGFLAAFAPFVISQLVRPRGFNHRKTLRTYECGMDPYHSAREYRFGISFYVYAVIFLAFDVDVLYLFPVTAVYNSVDGMRPFFEVLIFIGILSLAVVYAWGKGVFTWPKKRKTC